MSHPGRIGAECPDCGAEMQAVGVAGGEGLRCPWSSRDTGRCRRPYGRPRIDPASEYARDQLRKRTATC